MRVTVLDKLHLLFMHAKYWYQPTITMKVVCIQVALTVYMMVALSHVHALPMADEQRSGSNNAIQQHLTSTTECEKLIAVIVV